MRELWTIYVIIPNQWLCEWIALKRRGKNAPDTTKNSSTLLSLVLLFVCDPEEGVESDDEWAELCVISLRTWTVAT